MKYKQIPTGNCGTPLVFPYHRILVGIEKAIIPDAMAEKFYFQIASSQDASKLFFNVLSLEGSEVFEYVFIAYLSRRNRVLGVYRVSEGGFTGSIIDIKKILIPALAVGASAMVLCHNHPSGNLKPSQQDVDITSKLKDAAKLLDVTLVDHLILGEGKDYYSFADNGNLW